MQALMFAPLGCVEAQWEAVGEILPWKKNKKTIWDWKTGNQILMLMKATSWKLQQIPSKGRFQTLKG